MMWDLDSEKLMAMGSFVVKLLQCRMINCFLGDKKINQYWTSIVLFGFYSVLLGCSIISSNYLVNSFFILVDLVIVVDAGIKDKIIHALKIFVIRSCFSYVAQMMVSFIRKTEVISMIEDGDFFGEVFLLFVLVVMVVVKKYILIKVPDTIRQKWWKYLIYGAMIVMGISIPMTISGFGFAASYVKNPDFTKVANIVSVFAFCGILFLILFIFYVEDANKKMKTSLETEKLLMETQKRYYQIMLEKAEDTRRFRHDFLNHITCLKGLIEKEDNEAVFTYICQMQGQMQEIQENHKNCYTVGNNVIDVILNGLLPQLKDTDVTVGGTCTQQIMIDHVELCTIVANLIKNAIEELNHLENDSKYLKIKVEQGTQYMKFTISNSSRMKKMNISSKLPLTTKADKKNHGIGLRNVRETVEKNQGKFLWEYKENEFKVEIALPLIELKTE